MRSVDLRRLSFALALAFTGCRGGGSATPGTAGTTGTAGTGGSLGGAGGIGGDETGGGGSGGVDGAVAFSKGELLNAFATCAAAGVRDFQTKAVALDAAAAAYVATPDEASRTAAREAFRQAMASWQIMDILQYGPTGSGAKTAGGKDFRDNIHAWPTFGPCAVDEALVAKTYASASFGMALANRRGLPTIEYLLFNEGQDSLCLAGSPVLAGWMALTPTERDARKRAYAAAAARDVLARATALDAAWDPTKGNFVQTMRSAGPGNGVYPTVQDAIQAVGLAIFYLDQWVKDLKLANPLDGTGPLESSFAKLSKANIRANLEGLRLVMEGCDGSHGGLAFDDLLVNINAGDVAATLKAQTLAALEAVDAIAQPDLDQAIAADRAAVERLRTAVGTVTTTIKTSFYTVLNFEASILPTDNDS